MHYLTTINTSFQNYFFLDFINCSFYFFSVGH
nr:MAG TPA: hypothetical protein [Caudoviricetes sp.]